MDREKAFGFLTTLILICCSCLSFAQSTSSQGKEFWTAYMSHIEDSGESQMALYITSDEATKVTVEVADGSFMPIVKDVTPHIVTIIDIPKIVFLKDGGKFSKGIHITSEKNIAAYAHIYAANVSGATLLLPVAVLGKNYYSINYNQQSNAQGKSYSTVMIVGTENNTSVEITPSAGLSDGHLANVPFTIALNKGEVYQGLSSTDLTNTKIKSISSATGECKKIAVFSGSTKIGIGCGSVNGEQFSSDNLFQQVYPTASWGKNYITVPLKERNYDIFRVFLSDPNTTLKVNNKLIAANQIKQNNVYEFSSDVTNVITADKPVQVVQYAVTQGRVMNSCEHFVNDVGDPEMIYLNPLEQTLNHITLYSTSAFAIEKNFINVVMKSNKASTFKLDGEPYTQFTAILNSDGYAYAQIKVDAGTHFISADDGFNAIAYGFGDHESYGYSAGTNLKNLNEYINFLDPVTNVSQLNGCTGVPYKVQLVLPYQTTKIIWNLNDGSGEQTVDNPVATPFQKDGVTLYRYDYLSNKTFDKGSYHFTTTVVNSVADECGTVKDIDFDFSISDFAKTDFKYSGNLCSATEITLHDESVVDPASVSQIKIWWDFINHPESFELFNSLDIPAGKNYHHIYDYSLTTTNYVIKMAVYTGDGAVCENAKERPITILGSPAVSMNTVAPICQDASPMQIVADNHGFIGSGIFSGTGITPQGLFNPAVSGPGIFKIAYHFVATNTCDVTVTQDIVVNPLPTVQLPLFLPLLEGESLILKPAVTGENLSYQWLPETGLDNSNVLNPVCSAIDDTQYKLTVTTAFGCAAVANVFVKVLKKPVIVSAFSPNGDGINDTWVIKYLDTYPGNTVDIYNRQGEKVYSSVGYSIPWNGVYRGAVLPTGTYYYIINPKNGRKVISGSVTIIK